MGGGEGLRRTGRSLGADVCLQFINLLKGSALFAERNRESVIEHMEDSGEMESCKRSNQLVRCDRTLQKGATVGSNQSERS